MAWEYSWTVVEFTEAFGNRSLSLPDRLDLGARQFYSCDEGVEEFIFELRLAVFYIDGILHNEQK